MQHIMLDIVGVDSEILTVEDVNELLNKAIINLGLKAVMPCENIPYYYCKNANDGGISSYCILSGGHITIHSFPFYGVCYIDILYEKIDEEKAYEFFLNELNPVKIDKWFCNRDDVRIDKSYSPESDFGPHVLAVSVLDKPLGLEECYSVLDSISDKIDMHPISRPRVITNKIKDYDYISGMLLIAESHIAIHSNVKTGKVYLDIYSCRFCPCEKLYSVVCEILGEDCNNHLISRGKKTDKAVKEGYSLSNTGWMENI